MLARLAAKGDRIGGLYHALALGRLGRPVSARRAADRLVARFPDDPEVLAAAAVTHFDKQNPSAGFGRLGPLSRRFPQAATVRFHLGLLLIWSKQIAPARRQLERAARLEPASPIAAEARRYLATLDGVAKR